MRQFWLYNVDQSVCQDSFDKVLYKTFWVSRRGAKEEKDHSIAAPVKKTPARREDESKPNFGFRAGFG